MLPQNTENYPQLPIVTKRFFGTFPLLLGDNGHNKVSFGHKRSKMLQHVRTPFVYDVV